MTDELKPVRCGCGGEATVDCYLGGLDKNDLYYVYCPECNIQTANYLIEAEAITAWNKAMGNRMELQTVERTAKVDAGYKSVINGKLMDGHCMTCGRYVMDEDDYCPGCGARLEWE